MSREDTVAQVHAKYNKQQEAEAIDVMPYVQHQAAEN